MFPIRRFEKEQEGIKSFERSKIALTPCGVVFPSHFFSFSLHVELTYLQKPNRHNQNGVMHSPVQRDSAKLLKEDANRLNATCFQLGLTIEIFFLNLTSDRVHLEQNLISSTSAD